MMFITRILKRTTGEDNEKTEMCVSSLSLFQALPIADNMQQVHDRESKSANRPDSFCSDIGLCLLSHPASYC